MGIVHELSFATQNLELYDLQGCNAEALRESPHPHGKVDYEREYEVKSIVDETKTTYQISWEDDEVTGEKFLDTWEPKQNVNQLAIDDWERQKRAERSKPFPSSCVSR